MRSYLNNCRKIEQVMAEVYRKLAGVRTYSQQLRRIFEQMAQDEDDHAMQLELAKGIPEEIFFEGYRLEPEHVDELLRRAYDLLRMANDPPRSESRMLETAKEIEKEFMEVHLLNAVKFRHAGMADLFRDMAREDERHLETLDSYQSQGEDATRRTLH